MDDLEIRHSISKLLKMQISVVTKEDLEVFKNDLLGEMEKILKSHKLKSEQTAFGNFPKDRKWMKSTEARKMLNISQGTFHKLKINGIIPYSRIGKVCLYDYDELVKIIQANKIHNGIFRL